MNLKGPTAGGTDDYEKGCANRRRLPLRSHRGEKARWARMGLLPGQPDRLAVGNQPKQPLQVGLVLEFDFDLVLPCDALDLHVGAERVSQCPCHGLV